MSFGLFSSNKEKMKMTKTINVTTSQINEWATAHRQNRMFYIDSARKIPPFRVDYELPINCEPF